MSIDASERLRRLLAVFHDLASCHGPLLTSAGVEQVLPTYGDEWANYRDSGRPINVSKRED